MTKEQKFLLLIVLIISGASATYYVNDQKNIIAQQQQSAVQINEASLPVTEGINTGVFSSDISYLTPNKRGQGFEKIHVSITLDKGVISDISFSYDTPTNNDSADYLSSFKQSLNGVAFKGKRLADISLSRVGVASLTSRAFMRAISDISNKQSVNNSQNTTTTNESIISDTKNTTTVSNVVKPSTKMVVSQYANKYREDDENESEDDDYVSYVDPTPTNITTNPSQTQSVSKDGTYKTDVTYRAPDGYSETIHLSTDIKAGVINNFSFSYDSASNPTSAGYLSRFDSNLSKSLIIGKKITDISLSRVGGSSLTTRAFNKAIGQISLQSNG